jgi:quinol monooxygenase YgiN
LPEETLRVVAHFHAKPGKEDDLRDLLLGLLTPTRQETGCIRYELHGNEGDPAEFTFIEEWTDGAALDAHLQTDHIKHVISQAPDLLAAKLDVRRYKLIG